MTLQANFSRRGFIKLSGGAAATLMLAACGGLGGGNRPIKIGLVAPNTGPLAAFAEADEFIIAAFKEIFKDGIEVGGNMHPIEIITKDSQSDPNRAAQVAADLILKDEVDIMAVHSTPETNNPVSAQCEANEMPLISTDAPWQPWYFRDDLPSPEEGYKWGYHFFWGLEDIIGVFLDIWGSLDTNKTVGALWPNDGDGLAWADSERGFPPALEAAGFTVVDPGRYENLKDDFSAEISLFKEQGVEIVTGVMLPPDLGTFLTQASQQGFNPKAFTVGKAALFPTTVETLPDGLGEGLTTEVWWTPSHPFNSSLTGQSAQELADAYTAETGKQWTQPIGFVHGMFEILADVLKRTEDIEAPESILKAIQGTNLDTIVGKLSWGSGPVPNVAKTPLVGGQWKAGEDYPFEMVVATNNGQPDIPAPGSIEPKKW